MALYDSDGMRTTTAQTQGVWTTCDECHEDWWCVVHERDEMDEPLSWICSDNCIDEDAEEWD